jgi:hypothetical protein
MNQKQETPGPGIVVLSSSLQILHMNQRARALLAQNIETKRNGNGSFLQPYQDLLHTWPTRLASKKNWEQLQDRTIGDSRVTIFVKRFDRPDPISQTQSRIVLLLSPQAPAAIPETSDGESSSFLARITSPVRRQHAWLRTNRLSST